MTLVDERTTGLILVNLSTFNWSSELNAERVLRNIATCAIKELRSRKRRPQPGDLSLPMATGPEHRTQQSGGSHAARRSPSALDDHQAIASRSSVELYLGPIERRQCADVMTSLDALLRRGVDTTLFLSRDEPLALQMERQKLFELAARWPNLKIERGLTRDHMHRSASGQREVDAAVERVVSRVREAFAA